MAGKLTTLSLRSQAAAAMKTAKAARIQDGDGLSLLVATKAATGTWVYRFMLDGRRRDMSLGRYPDIGLSEARAAAAEARAEAKAGNDPVEERHAARRVRQAEAIEDRSFRGVAEECVKSREGGWRNEKSAAQWRSTLGTVYPELGNIRVDRITSDDVLRVLKPIWTKTPETASRLRGRVEAVLDYAAARKLRSGENAARWRGNLSELLHAPRQVAKVEHQPALPWQQMPEFMAALGKRAGMAAKALAFVILTGTRSGEVRGMTWGELDAEASVWTIPGRRMKGGKLHRVPISAAALAVLRSMMPGNTRPSADTLVFPAPSGKPLSDMALSMLVRGMASDGLACDQAPRWGDVEGRAIVPHGFRSTFRDWAGECFTDGHILAERALAHAVRDKVEAAYARSDLLERRRPMMERWGEHCTGAPKVVALRPKKAG